MFKNSNNVYNSVTNATVFKNSVSFQSSLLEHNEEAFEDAGETVEKPEEAVTGLFINTEI